jgi:hypothetical protein
MNTPTSGGEPVTPKLDAEGNPIPAEPQVDAEGNPIAPAPAASPTGDEDEEFDADGNLIAKPSGDSDPLDAIEDEEQRRLAKAGRAMARRAEKKEGVKFDENGEPIVEPAQPVAPAPAAPAAATKDDLKILTLNAAKKLVPQEVLDVWDDLKTVPLGGFDSLDADSVATNMIKRYNVYRMDNPADPENPAAPLSTSPRIPTGGAGNKTPQSAGDGKKELPGFKEPTQPEDWYPAPEEQK